MPSTPNKRKSSRHVLYKYTYFLLSVKLNDEVKLNCIFFDCEKTKISFLNWQFDFSSVVYDCSSCLCLHWLLCCPISCVPGWLVTSFSTSYLFLFLQSLRFFIFFIFFFSLFVSVINKRWALYFMQYILVAKHYLGKTSDKYCNTCFLFGRRVKPSGGDNLFIRLNGKTWLEAKNWVTLSSWRHQRFNGFSNFQIIQHQNLWLLELYIS